MPVTSLSWPPLPVPRPGRVGIIDIGSNSIRLVVYDGPARIPAILFNEKVMAGLGKGLAKDGGLEKGAMKRAIVALGRFQRLAREMNVSELRVVATAAVREATNGADFLTRLHGLGLEVEVLSGDEEATMAGYGVLAGIPEADGIVGDLGGGSLELVRVRGGEVHERVSLPLGVLRIGAIRAKGRSALDQYVARALKPLGWDKDAVGLPFYLVGGSWRALARLDMTVTGHPLPIIHHYKMPADRPAKLLRVLARADKRRLRDTAGVSSSRVPSLPDATALLSVLVRRLRTSELIASAYGLREGLLHRSLAPSVRAQDPLICAAREEGVRQGRFPEHGDLLERWIAPLFGDGPPAEARLRHAACLLADVGWRANPEFRSERGLEIALHGNWVGIDPRGRAMMARALYVSFGDNRPVPVLERLCPPDALARADRWGLAMRLGQRLSGGVAAALEASRLSLRGTDLVLHLARSEAVLYGEAVERRHKALAAAFGRRAVMLEE